LPAPLAIPKIELPLGKPMEALPKEMKILHGKQVMDNYMVRFN
jgi:hypothetical protein